MTPEQRQLVDDLFDQAISLDADQRKTFLDGADIHEPCIRREVEELLLHHEQAEKAGFLESFSSRAPDETGHRASDLAPKAWPELLDDLTGYEILGVLGRGGMGIVYQARQIRLNRIVAIKMILDSQFSSSKARQRFLAEAGMIARVRHPNIVQIHEANTHKTGPYFSMEFVEGGSLAAKLQGKPFPVRQAAELVQTLASAIQAAHEAGIIHRDLKPANVLLTTDGVPKIMDFGVACELTDGPGMTESGVVLGTPSYMAPEQARGQQATIGPACDVYALGAILYELLTGRPPFAAENSLETILQVVNLEPVPPRQLQPKIPRDLATICLKCLQKDPTKRFTSAQDLADDLNRFLRSEPILARPVGRAEIAWRYCQRNPTQAVLMATLFMTLIFGLMGMTWNWREARKYEARKKVEFLLEAETARVPQLVDGILKSRPYIDALLHNEFTKSGDGSKEKLNLALMLLTPSFQSPPQEQATLSRYLFERLLDEKVENLRVIRETLSPYKRYVLQDLWHTAMSPAAEPPTEPVRLRAASALAGLAPQDDIHWKEIEETIAKDLLNVPKVHLYLWMELLSDLKDRLIAPLALIFQNPNATESERLLAADLLAVFADENPAVLARLLVNADVRQFALIFPKLRDSQRVEEIGIPELNRALIESSTSTDVPSSDERRELSAKQQVNAAVALLRLNRPDEVWNRLKFAPDVNSDPRVRSYLIHGLSELGVDATTVLAQLTIETDISARRALILSLGEFHGLSRDTIAKLLPLLQEVYLHDPDPGLHAAAEWLLRSWQNESWLRQINQQWADDWQDQTKIMERIIEQTTRTDTTALRRWIVNSQHQTLVVLRGPIDFEMGSPMTEANRHPLELKRHRVHIGRTFAIGAKPITVENYNAFLAERYPPAPGEPPHTLERMFPGELTRLLLKDPEKPAVFISWADAARYCNWLSAKEGLPKDQWCYDTADPLNDLTVKPRERYLSLTGYRLPTEAEREFATRAGSSTARYFGETDELLTNYAWYKRNSLEPLSDLEISQPVGRKKPNDFGLFDTQGNVWEWCQQKYRQSEYTSQVIEDQEDEWEPAAGSSPQIGGTTHPQLDISLVLHGGSSREKPKDIRSSARTLNAPSVRDAYFGFRLARTIHRPE